MRVGTLALMQAGDDVDRRTLRREHEMDADGACHLREAGDGLLDVGAVEHHQVGELVDDDDDVRAAAPGFTSSKRYSAAVSKSLLNWSMLRT